ncbi:MAG: two-component system, OmpR family, sensor histidine kinase MtrB [Chloroflexota bacterium]|jgi:two-component system sensor histidine kinase MtrB|nr:two-component system, OmpR family, sensor histidine kinase MtrB [Chloroflexota bacterium]
MIRGVRARLTATIVALVVVTAAVLGVAASLFTDARLHQQALDDARDQARFDLTVLAPTILDNPPSAENIAELAAAFRFRSLQSIIVPTGGLPSYDPTSLDGTLDAIPASVRQFVNDGQIAYSWQQVGGVPSLIVGGRAAGTGPEIYLVHDVRPIEQALGQLRLALAVGALLAVVVAIVAARVVARGVLAPVDEASRAAQRIERGDLAARVPVTSDDEFGVWADRFNRMADSLEDTIVRLEAAQAQNRRFVADVSHELRTPVTALVAEASLLRDHLGALPPEARRTGELVIQDIGRMRALVEDLMELSRFDAAGEEVRLQPVDLGRLVRDVAAARHPDAVLELPDERVIVDSEPRRLERILANLLDNAREHAPGALVVVRLRVAADEIAVVVLDRGPGVPPDRLDRIFERFYMADPSRRGGSGLGLAIAAENAALLGGELRARNRSSGGLEMELRLPVTERLPDGDRSAIRDDQGERR